MIVGKLYFNWNNLELEIQTLLKKNSNVNELKLNKWMGRP